MNSGRDVVMAPAPVAPVAPAGRNVVVAIGIDRYRDRRWSGLRNAVSDAVGAAQAFKQLGFEEVVPPLLDELATGDAIDQLVTDELARELRPEDSLVVFYAGHGGVRSQTVGVHEVNTGHLIPADAGETYASWIELKPWLEKIARLPPQHILVILDACKAGIALS
ncbi:MAG: caspase family protein, partial [Kofleriaceae bacterium]